MTTTTDTTSVRSPVERVRHPFRARHVQLLRRETISPGFVRLTLAGPELDGFASAGFDDHVKLILPQAGQDKPNLPAMVDGRPHIEGERPTMRDYTPLDYDAQAQTLTLEFAAHGSGPAVDWALNAPIGQWCGLAGPRGSMVVAADLDWHLFFGDETAMPAIGRRLAELPAEVRAIVRIQVNHPADQRAWSSRAALDLAYVPSLPEAAAQLQLPPGDGFIWGGGENTVMAAVREQLLAKGANAKRMRISSYWKQGEADHHEELVTQQA